MSKQLAAAILTAVALASMQSLASAAGWGCYTCGFKNGTQLTGIADPASADRDRLEWFGGCDEWGCGSNGLQSDGRAIDAEQPAAATSIILPGGEVLDLR